MRYKKLIREARGRPPHGMRCLLFVSGQIEKLSRGPEWGSKRGLTGCIG